MEENMKDFGVLENKMVKVYFFEKEFNDIRKLFFK